MPPHCCCHRCCHISSNYRILLSYWLAGTPPATTLVSFFCACSTPTACVSRKLWPAYILSSSLRKPSCAHNNSSNKSSQQQNHNRYSQLVRGARFAFWLLWVGQCYRRLCRCECEEIFISSSSLHVLVVGSPCLHPTIVLPQHHRQPCCALHSTAQREQQPTISSSP